MLKVGPVFHKCERYNLRMPSDKPFINERAALLLDVAMTARTQADGILNHKWSEIDWEWLEKKLPIEDVDRLFEIARREDKASGEP